ncbi:unknown protein [Spodoptera frugiperda multiple nucleopolyhedrovirus]|uniref:Sf11 n=1 Tax=Spodoptera frugiperda nuclear polyhedrosis virus TaxID=10455 RepID=A1YJ01_NPVSF|nr:hypothetical protein SFMNPV_gp011 [Spodoptera frugiperda multiple nucleopolyhedrovirus]ABM45722.1 unknown protein [Spodoptera frugiperda multiple nucleopolyhedrovirus]ACA02568.1 unknown [Spodoptera frugiperda multiple nucleopolyhedrovirus]ADV91242.1 hypothetical protein Sf11 [Spodoptera frugiperda multiple nucleopolyhedrovirus]AFH58957.1 hypothetical protein Sf11 [Spodoptera frugiperda multiple nucleopolyhedrovirus]AIW01422.1 hypothetical protein [Spodoptera frugiperda multiple nucleopolyhe
MLSVRGQDCEHHLQDRSFIPSRTTLSLIEHNHCTDNPFRVINVNARNVTKVT